jgi:hypothetical protein
MLRTIQRATSAVLTLGAVGTYELAHAGALPYVLAGVLVLMLAGRRSRRVERSKPPPDTTTATLKLRLLRARLVTTEARLAILAPDVALAARDLEAGRIGPEDYATALDVAARAAQARPRSRSRFHFPHS